MITKPGNVILLYVFAFSLISSFLCDRSSFRRISWLRDKINTIYRLKLEVHFLQISAWMKGAMEL